MAGMNVVINISGIGAVNAKLEGVVSRSQDLTVPMKMGAQLMMGSVNDNFSQSGRPSAWRALAPSTLRQKIRKGYSSRPLVRTGILKSSISPKVDKESFRVGTSVSYAGYNQFGTRKMPARPFVVFQDHDVQDINKLVVDYIKGK